MKKTISLFMLIFIFQIFTNAQCDVKKYEFIKKYVKEGIFLMGKSYNNKKDKPYKLVLDKGATYGIYLLNPSKSLPDIELKTKEGMPIQNIETKIDTKENYAFYKFTIKKSGQYRVSLNFNTPEKACVLFVLTYICKKNE